MLARALIVLLVVLNLGVTAWWMARDEVAPAAVAVESPTGVARLQLLREGEGARAAVAPRPSTARPPQAQAPPPAAEAAAPAGDAAAAAVPSVANAVDSATHCYALGPFADADKVAAARRQLQPRAARLHVREVASAKRRDWRVWLPPQADRAAAQALVGRITAAGFSDYYIVASGDEANSISLGLYGSEESARRRQAALQAAGFADVRADPLGDAPPSATWIDVAGTAPLAAADGKALGAQQVQPIDCDTVPAAPSAATR
ncbi:MAG: SPOR domain-containing protein [Luteimonas sp.]|nr:SPOR domain-containing protein [Luteimonas sp.]